MQILPARCSSGRGTAATGARAMAGVDMTGHLLGRVSAHRHAPVAACPCLGPPVPWMRSGGQPVTAAGPSGDDAERHPSERLRVIVEQIGRHVVARWERPDPAHRRLIDDGRRRIQPHGAIDTGVGVPPDEVGVTQVLGGGTEDGDPVPSIAGSAGPPDVDRLADAVGGLRRSEPDVGARVAAAPTRSSATDRADARRAWGPVRRGTWPRPPDGPTAMGRRRSPHPGRPARPTIRQSVVVDGPAA